MVSKSNKQDKVKLNPGESYLFCRRGDLSLGQHLFLSEAMPTAGQLYGVMHGELKAIDGYAKRIDEYNKNLFECLGIGEFVGIDFDNGELSVGLKSFLEKPENREHAKNFFPRLKKQS